MKKIKLRLTGVGSVLTEAAEKKLEASEENVLQPTCDNGRTMEDYENLNFPQDKIPKELIQRQKEYELGVKLEDQDFEEIYSDVSIYAEDILLMVEDEDLTTIFLRNSDIRLTVLETVEEIDSFIEYLSLNSFLRWWLGFKISFLNFFRGKKELQQTEIE
jgi:hypothetical protein